MKFKTGDIILFNNESFGSTIIKLFSGGPYSHSGVVVVREDDTYLLESAGGDDVDEISGKTDKFGVKLTLLQPSLDYATDYEVIPIKEGLDIQDKMEEFITKYKDAEFPRGLLNLYFRMIYEIHYTDTSFICTDVVVLFMREVLGCNILNLRYFPVTLHNAYHGKKNINKFYIYLIIILLLIVFCIF
jgi:hypothetical protein